MLPLLLLTLTALLAGLIDAIAGGGGLLTLPALILAGLPPHTALGTNKGQAVFGSAVALLRYFHSPLLDRPRAIRSFFPALLGSAIGALAVSFLDPKILRPVIVALLAAVALFMLFYKPPHTTPAARVRPVLSLVIAFSLAFYDGFFGPGVGTFLIIAYVLLMHDSLAHASANAKLVNFASNLAAMLLFAARGNVLWHYALPMAAAQSLGAFIGAHLTIKHGRPLVRYATITVSLALLAKLSWDIAH